MMPGAGAAATAFERRACAKINLDLRVGTAGPDGYHTLETVFQTLSLHDTLGFEPTAPGAPFLITCNEPGVPTDRRNLVWQAASGLWAALGRDGDPRGVCVRIRKAIPAQAGLGGGSSDAAVALVALHELWGGTLGGADLARLAGRLGADAPFFLVGGTARGVGRGDQLEPWPDLPAFEVVIAVPAFGVPTADAYRWFDEAIGLTPGARRREPSEHVSPVVPGREPGIDMSWPLAGPADAWVAGVRRWFGGCRNDLEAPVEVRHPLIGALRRALVASGAIHAMLSGSGSTVFGLFEEPGAADAGAGAVGAAGVAVLRSRTLTRDEYRRYAFGRRAVPALPGA